MCSSVTGIGKAVAEYLLSAPENHNVVVVARSADLLRQLEEKYAKRVKVVSGDLGTLSLAQEAVKAATEGFGQLDGMVLNHGCLGQISEIGTVDLDQWKKAFDVNFFSMVVFVCLFSPSPRKYLNESLDPGSVASSPHSQGKDRFHFFPGCSSRLSQLGPLFCHQGRGE